MNRAVRHLLIALALLFTQQAGQLHALSHLKHNLNALARGGESAPPVDHKADRCIAFHAFDSALPVLAFAVEPPRAATQVLAGVARFSLRPPRIVFDSRAPPALS
ncbi:MAG: hypothetical protein HY017_07280 [Betaproteobacteria bacterium]|nr:hypothetical protein [Betaproteobacteria bacterium]